jgi:hypothetical protein
MGGEQGVATTRKCNATLRLIFGTFIWVILAGSGSFSAGQTITPPVLISESNSTRAVALESVTFRGEPFPLVAPYELGQDQRTRVMLFALNLAIRPGGDLSVVTADAEDASHQHYNLKVEYVGPVPSQEWLSAVILRLSDDIGDVGDVLVRVTYHGVASNRVHLAIGHTGVELPDDAGSAPTPAPPYLISGKVTERNGQPLFDIPLTLNGARDAIIKTGGDGSYAFSIDTPGNYTVTLPTSKIFTFAPQSKSLTFLTGNHNDLNFVGTRKQYMVGGKVLYENGAGADGIPVTLSDSAGVALRTIVTANGGAFSFTDVPAGFGYSVAAAGTYVFDFARQNINELSDNLALNLTAMRRNYAITGVVADSSKHGMGGVIVKLSGNTSESSTVTDKDGNYEFDGLPAGEYFMVTPAKADYVFSPTEKQIYTYAPQGGINFTAIRSYTISGRVTGSTGENLRGVTLTIAGPQTTGTVTAADGTYSLTVTAAGDYIVTPSFEQDYYSFTPRSRQISGLSSDQTLNFTAQTAPFPDPPYVLEFDGSPKTVDYGYFWNPNVNLGHFFWEFWAMPGGNAGATYMLSDGYGGAHALLFGVANYNGSEPGRYQLLGNINDGVISSAHIFYFGSDQGPAPGEWGHFAVGWDGQSIITYFNGVPVGKRAFAGPRQTPGPGQGGSRLLIGGSDHSNFSGRIAQVRGFEDSNPREGSTTPGVSTVESSFAPQSVFGIGGNLLSYYFRPGPRVADLSGGYDGSTHVGTPRGTTAGVLYDCGNCAPPQFVIDPNAPNFVAGTPQSPVAVSAPRPVPDGARVFDSFSRANSTYMFNGTGGLGSTEGGTAGIKTWQMSSGASGLKPFGILNGLAVMLGNETNLTWVRTDSTTGNLDIRVNRHAGIWGSGVDTGLSFRVTDAGNYFFAYTSESSQSAGTQSLTVGYYLNGVRTDLATVPSLPNNPQNPWTTLRVLTYADGRIQIFTDSTLVFTTTSAVLSNATGAGIYNNASGLALTNRWDNFAIFDAP